MLDFGVLLRVTMLARVDAREIDFRPCVTSLNI